MTVARENAVARGFCSECASRPIADKIATRSGRLKALIYSPYFFVAEGGDFDADDHTVASLADVVARAGIITWRGLNDKPLMQECIKSLDPISAKILERVRWLLLLIQRTDRRADRRDVELIGDPFQIARARRVGHDALAFARSHHNGNC
jgi:hypothetical protein